MCSAYEHMTIIFFSVPLTVQCLKTKRKSLLVIGTLNMEIMFHYMGRYVCSIHFYSCVH